MAISAALGAPAQSGKLPTAIVPFGKYKGQPIEALAQDVAYLDWLTAQDWFRSRYQNLYTIIINNFQAPSETPEHNLMQAKFLDEDYRFKFIYFSMLHKEQLWDELIDLEVEASGFDVRLTYSERRLKPRSHKPGLHDDRIIATFVECKPMLGDDYPAVLRQIVSSIAYQRWRSENYGWGENKGADWDIDGMRFILFIRQYSGSINRAQLIEFFSKASIQIIFESELDQFELERLVSETP